MTDDQQLASAPRSLGVVDLPKILCDLEENLIRSKLGEAKWNVAQAARLLMLNRTTLVEKLKKFKIERPRMANAP